MLAWKRCKNTPSCPALGPDEELDWFGGAAGPCFFRGLEKKTSGSGSEQNPLLPSMPSSNVSARVLQGIDSKLFLVLPAWAGGTGVIRGDWSNPWGLVVIPFLLNTYCVGGSPPVDPNLRKKIPNLWVSNFWRLMSCWTDCYPKDSLLV